MTSALVRFDPQSLFPSHIAEICALMQSVEALYQLTPLRSVSFAPTDTPGEYVWSVTATNGRTWNEMISFNPVQPTDANPSLTFDVPAGWYVTEVVAQRGLRDQLITLRNSIGLSVFDCGWIDTGSPSASIVELEVSPGTVAHGQPVNVSWIAPSAGNLDWIGLFAAGADVHAYLAYVYASGQNNGSHAFTAPSTPGQYEFRYLLNNGYTSVADSVPFTVT